MEKVVSSAVVVMPPESQWTQIQDIRAKHDKSYVRWMPHINLVSVHAMCCERLEIANLKYQKGIPNSINLEKNAYLLFKLFPSRYYLIYY